MNLQELTTLLSSVVVEVHLDERTGHFRVQIPLSDEQRARLRERVPLDMPVSGIAATSIFMAIADALVPGSLEDLVQSTLDAPGAVGMPQGVLTEQEADTAFQAARNLVGELEDSGPETWKSVGTHALSGDPDRFAEVSICHELDTVELGVFVAPSLHFAVAFSSTTARMLGETLTTAADQLEVGTDKAPHDKVPPKGSLPS